MNEILQDIVDIKESRPELTPEQWVIVESAATYYKALLKPELRMELETEYAEKRIQDLDILKTEMQARVEEQFKEWKESQKPLGTEDLKKLLSQEYERVEVPIYDSVTKEKRTFYIRELPKSVEKRFIELARNTIVPLLEDKALLDFKWKIDTSFRDKVQAILDLVPNSTDVAAEIAAICLDPYNKENINSAWVSENLSITRIEAIILIQIEANKYRDFFSNAFRLFQSLKTRTTA